MYGFTNTLFPPRSLDYESDRRMSNQWLDLNAMGPLVNGYFANYNARVRLQGTQIRSMTDGVKETELLSPAITNYFGSVGLFPNRPFPLLFYTGKTSNHNIRYEPANRNQVDIVDPGLTILRRYKTTNEGTGAQLRYAVTQDLELGFEGKTTHNQLERQYDFDENRNIWVDFSPVTPGAPPYFNIEIINHIPDHDVLFYVEASFVDTVKAGASLQIVIEEGDRHFEFIPIGLNSIRVERRIGGNELWQIYFNDPPGSKDLDQSNDIFSGKLNYGRNGRLTSDAYFEYNDGYETVQDMDNNLLVFNNLANYHLTPNATLNSLTNYSETLTDVGDISHNLSSVFMQQTNSKWRRPGGIGTSLTHSYFYMTSETGVDFVSSRNNIVNGLVNIPTNWKRHEVDLLASVNLLADSKQFRNKQLTYEMRNRLEDKQLGMRWVPRHNLKYSKSKQEHPFSNSNEVESKFRLEGEHPNIGPLGSLRVMWDWTWRRRTNEKGVDSRNKNIGEVGLTRRFGRQYKLKVLAGWEKEAFDFLDKEAELSAHPGAPNREPELRQSFRIDGMANPVPWFDMSANAMWIKTNESRIQKYSVSVSLRIPKLKIPIKSYVSKENRELMGVPPQAVFQAETKLSYNIRKIRLVVAHKYTDETLLTERYTYSEFLAKVSRDFDIY
ncbi:MAG: hypothetical protein ABFS42_15400 [Candidatus Krumholzibacteriota bacterium]